MNKKTGLGKGLNALFVDSNILEENVQVTGDDKDKIHKIKTKFILLKKIS